MAKQLRDFQEKVVNKVVEMKDDVLISAPTGCGKTFICEMIMKELSKKSKKSNFMFVVPRILLIDQFLDDLTAFKQKDFDIIQAKNTKKTGSRFILASKDSIDNRLNMVPENTIMLIDEVHEGLKQSFELVKKIRPARVIGLTATPERADGLSFMKGKDLENEEKLHKYGLFDAYINAITIREAQNLGYLSELEYISRNDLDTLSIKSSGVDEFTEEEITELFDKYNIWGDLVKTYKKYGRNADGTYRPALGFTNTVKMAKKVAGIFNAAGFNFKVVSGRTPPEERRDLVEAVKTGKINGLVNADLLTYGFNCPEISYIFSCRHIKSKSLWVQIIGRGLRPGKDKLVYVDHTDSVSEFSNAFYDLPFEAENFSWNYNGITKMQKERQSQERKEAERVRKFLAEYVFNNDEKLVPLNQENRNKYMIGLVKKFKDENENLRKILAAKYD